MHTKSYTESYTESDTSTNTKYLPSSSLRSCRVLLPLGVAFARVAVGAEAIRDATITLARTHVEVSFAGVSRPPSPPSRVPPPLNTTVGGHGLGVPIFMAP